MILNISIFLIIICIKGILYILHTYVYYSTSETRRKKEERFQSLIYREYKKKTYIVLFSNHRCHDYTLNVYL